MASSRLWRVFGVVAAGWVPGVEPVAAIEAARERRVDAIADPDIPLNMRGGLLAGSATIGSRRSPSAG
ncbi:hypothetical protein [Nonomuraea jiangxiensis]|uniref:Uncharacterized protein n=1 Tax=Nonomuraea jiangxiensis TaxID=633440 RepID=A0A1G8PXV3_9ACTN|nr:hypothetical protein [Nonomuraea jiangxiensis]SDI97198.1 hypothetical protein SAMN05421869_10864 [Nonomuraea jiangxiensis]